MSDRGPLPDPTERGDIDTELDLGVFTEVADGPMIVVTTTDGQERSGCLVGFHTQCSMDPPRYAVALSKRNHTYRVALRSSGLAISLLSEDQFALAELFGGHTADDDLDKFSRCEWDEGPGGIPLLAGAAARIAGEVVDRVDLGDHVLFVVAPRRVERAEPPKNALRFGDTEALGPGHP